MTQRSKLDLKIHGGLRVAPQERFGYPVATAETKKLMRTAADREHRSIVNMIEVLIRDYCGKNGITIQEQRTLPLDDECKL